MTTSKVSLSGTGSMPANVSGKSEAAQSTDPSWLGQLSSRWRLKPTYVRQQVYADFGVFERAADAVEEMLRDGRSELVALRCARLDTIRAAYADLEASTAEHRVLLHDNFEKDARENPATAAHAMEPSPVTWDTARRLLIAEVNAKLRLIYSGDCLYRAGR